MKHYIVINFIAISPSSKMIIPAGTAAIFPADASVSDPRPPGSHPGAIGKTVTETEPWARASPAGETPQTRTRPAAPASHSESYSAAPVSCKPPAMGFPQVSNSQFQKHPPIRCWLLWFVSLQTLTAILISTWFSLVVFLVCVTTTVLWSFGIICSSW